MTLPPGPGVTLTGADSRLSSGFSAVSEVIVAPLNVVVDPFPVDGAGTGNAYGSLRRTLLARNGAPFPVVTDAVLVSVHSPSVVPSALLLPSALNGTEFTRYAVGVPVLIAGSSPTTGSPASDTGVDWAQLTVVASFTSCDLEMTWTMAPISVWFAPQYSSVEMTSALLSNPVFGWSPMHWPPSEESNW